MGGHNRPPLQQVQLLSFHLHTSSYFQPACLGNRLVREGHDGLFAEKVGELESSKGGGLGLQVALHHIHYYFINLTRKGTEEGTDVLTCFLFVFLSQDFFYYPLVNKSLPTKALLKA